MTNAPNETIHPTQVNLASNEQDILHLRGNADQAIRNVPKDSGENHGNGISSYQSRRSRKKLGQRNKGKAQVMGPREHLGDKDISSGDETNPQINAPERRSPYMQRTNREKVTTHKKCLRDLNYEKQENQRKSSNASIKIASINMRGQRGSNLLIPPNKWEGINQTLQVT